MCNFAPDTRNCPEERCPALRITDDEGNAVTTCCGVTIPASKIGKPPSRPPDRHRVAGEWRNPKFTNNGGEDR